MFCGTSRPTMSGRYWALPTIRSAGTMAARRMSWPWETSWMKRVSALTRCTHPRCRGVPPGGGGVGGVVEMVDEAVQRRAPLHQPLLQAAPLVGRDDAGDQVERDQAFAARAVLVLGAIDGEGDAHAPEDHLGLGPAGLHQLRRLL